ncbi:DUF4290 domain-containing protein [Cytophagaceae bacterium DM2B3-1]|uniref:DUF4290 domain-containing protein n=2 Tax=Xanthocytophaga TaxID=3078918 RepID=A0AAE3U5N9_9BACT|nr:MULTISPECIES: DUF4290 domain-containing protein [Xanthocytophaga]MDJ1469209.1 DUF4290 domain-containing protein [Xanthocytophaga flavus]MDJ1480989.1 DUF4290 domain-containing protein [Xanthocytophaga flavus]MDJ1497535.1 DUF4290 domain-containing protein [Xanthocytophaga flavus]MDJ1505958.1 DUF4290 domain-containing protein [Xanthocytophaga agilis]
MENFEYNTQLEPLIQKEYGRNVQKLAGYLLTIDDKNKRTRLAHALIELMREIHPNMREGQDYTMKLWDDLYILTGFNLDVDSPYPPPEKTALGKKPQRVPYPTHEFRFKQYGYQVIQLVDKAIAITNREEQIRAIAYIGRLMKAFNQTWTEKNIEDEVVIQQIQEMSKGKLTIDLQTVKSEGLFEAEAVRRFDNRNDRNDRDKNRNNNNGNRNDKKNDKFGKKNNNKKRKK